MNKILILFCITLILAFSGCSRSVDSYSDYREHVFIADQNSILENKVSCKEAEQEFWDNKGKNVTISGEVFVTCENGRCLCE